MSEPLTRSDVAAIVHEEARAIAHDVLAERTIPTFPAYFVNRHWLVTYDWLAYECDSLRQRIAHLEQRLARLERPWWKRWLNR